jgi:cold-inducible RNA-binding protein
LNPAVINRYTAAIATVKSDPAGKADHESTRRLEFPVYVCSQNIKRGLVMKIYVGNLSFDVTEEELQAEFAAFGKVESVNIITDKYSGRPRGFAFVEMPSVAEGQAAIAGLNGKTIKDRSLTVNAARPRPDDRGGSFRGRRGGGGSGGFGGGRGRRY